MSIYKSYRKVCPDFIVNDFVTRVIKTVPIRAGYNTIRVTLKDEKLTDKAFTYCALTALTVVCRKGCLVNIVDLVVKSAPKNEKLRRCIPINQLFSREAYFYNTIVVELIEFQEEVNLSVEERFQGVPTLLAASANEGEEALVLQNSGIGGVPRFERWVGELTRDRILTVLKEFSRFHALSFAFGMKKPERLSEFKKELKQGYLSTLENEHTLKIIKNNLTLIVKHYTDDVSLKKLNIFEQELEGFLNNILNNESDTNVLIHGDPTTTVLFSCGVNTDNNTSTKAKFIDWQLVRFGSPIVDLSLFLVTNCSGDELQNIPQLLREYHSYLEKFCKGFSLDINDFFSFKRLEDEWKKYAKFALALSFLNFKIFSLDLKNRPNIDKDSTCDNFLERFIDSPNEDFIKRIKEIIQFYFNNDLI